MSLRGKDLAINTQDDCEKLFLLEVLVESLYISLDSLELDKNLLLKLTETCVQFQFLHYPPLVVCESDFVGQPLGRRDNDIITFKSGKSCFFSLRSPRGRVLPVPFEINVNVIKKLQEGVLPDKLVIGKTIIAMSEDFTELLNQNTDENCDALPLSKHKKGTFELESDSRKPVGKLTAFIRLSCFGKLIITQFSLNKEDEASYFFKGTETKKPCVSDKQNGNQVRRSQDIEEIEPSFRKKICDKPDQRMFDASEPRKYYTGERNYKDGEILGPVFDKDHHNRTKDGAKSFERMVDVRNPRRCYTSERNDRDVEVLGTDFYKNRQRDGPKRFEGLVEASDPTRYYTGERNEVLGSDFFKNKPYSPTGGFFGTREGQFPRNLVDPGSKKECGCPVDYVCQVSPFPTPPSVMSRNTQRTDRNLGLGPGEVGLQDDQVIFQMPLKKPGDPMTEQDKQMDSSVYYKLTSAEETKDGYQKNTVHVNTNDLPGMGKGAVGPVSGLPVDDGHDVFLLKIGKKCDGDKKRNLELELRTPKMKEPKPPSTDQSTQYLESDIPRGSGAGKGSKDKKKGGGKEKGKKGKK